jgi:hypothetical protein
VIACEKDQTAISPVESLRKAGRDLVLYFSSSCSRLGGGGKGEAR